MSVNRRSFIRYASLAAAGNAVGLRPFGAINGLAATPSYKALVCIFMYGGNDSNNMLVPLSTSANGTNNYTAYSKIRGPLAIPVAICCNLGASRTAIMACTPVCPASGPCSTIGHVAIVANVGTLVTASDFGAVQGGKPATPTNLFSHPDQQLEWQNAATKWSYQHRLGRADRRQSRPQLQPHRTDSARHFGIWGQPLLQRRRNIACGRQSRQRAGRSLQQECVGLRQPAETAQQLVTFKSGLSLVQADNAITGMHTSTAPCWPTR